MSFAVMSLKEDFLEGMYRGISDLKNMKTAVKHGGGSVLM